MSKTCFALPTYKHNAAGPLNHERPSCIFPEIQDKVPFEYNIQSCVRAFSQQKGTAKWYMLIYQIKGEQVFVEYVIDRRQDYRWLIQ